MRFTASGKAVCNFSVAVERRFKVNDKWDGVTTWHNCVVWEALAENVAATIQKGNRVIVSGYPEIEEYEARDGTTGRKLVLRAEEVGASLKWARADITKISREDREGNTTQSSGQGGKAANTTRGNDPVYGDEEPF
jgi:single-strand DNA-binding protein